MTQQATGNTGQGRLRRWGNRAAPVSRLNVTIPPDRQPFEMAGRSPACLLLHGFTGDPREMRPLADAINGRLGFHVYAPLFPGHGGPPHLLGGLATEDFYALIRGALAQLRENHSQVVVVAYSMGAALAAQVLSEEPVAAFIMLAPMLSIRNPLLPLAPVGRYVLPWIYPLKMMNVSLFGLRDEILSFDPTLDLDDPATIKMLKDEIKFPIAITDELRRMQNKARRAVNNLRMPTLIVQGSADLTLNPNGARRFFDALPAPDKTYKLIPRVDHDIVKQRNPGHADAVETVVRWLGERFD
jgi:carboxylesterase